MLQMEETETAVYDLEALSDQLIQEMYSYKSATTGLIHQDLEHIEPVISSRQESLENLQKLFQRFDQVIQGLPPRLSSDVKKLRAFHFSDLDSQLIHQELSGLFQRQQKLSDLVEEVRRLDRQLQDHMIQQRAALHNQMQGVLKSQKVINFIGATNQMEIFNGNTLDKSL